MSNVTSPWNSKKSNWKALSWRPRWTNKRNGKKTAKAEAVFVPELEFFKEFTEFERSTYAHVLSFEPLFPMLVGKLCEHLDAADEGKKVKQELASTVTENYNDPQKIVLVLDQIDGARNWVDYVVNLVKGGDENDDDLDAVAELSKFVSHPEYAAWSSELCRRHAKIRKMKADFAQKNLGLINSYINRLLHMKTYRDKLPVEDVKQECYFALNRAIEKFDYTKGWRFSTYAAYWLKHQVQRYMENHGDLIRIPTHSHTKRLQIRMMQRAANAELGRDLTTDELKAELNVDDVTLGALLLNLKFKDLDGPLHENTDQRVSETLADFDGMPPVERIASDQISRIIEQSIATLSPSEQLIIRDRYGFTNSNEELTLAEVGKKLNLSRERIRQIQEQALEKLKTVITNTNRNFDYRVEFTE